MSAITPAVNRQADTAVALADIHAVLRQADLASAREIEDATALWIAALWQSPGTSGRNFAALASGLPVEVESLLHEIYLARQEIENAFDGRALDCLATWALNHPSRS